MSCNKLVEFDSNIFTKRYRGDWVVTGRTCMFLLQLLLFEASGIEGFKFTCSIINICMMDGGTRARGRDSASSSFRLRVMMFLKWRRASCRTDGSLPWRRCRCASGSCSCRQRRSERQNTYLDRVEDGLQHGQNIAEEEVPRISQRVQQLLTWVKKQQKFFFLA